MVVIAQKPIDSRLYYLIENLLGELSKIIIHFKNVPFPVIDFYEELQYLSDEIDYRKGEIDVDIDDAIENLNDMYQDVLDIFFEELEQQAPTIVEKEVVKEVEIESEEHINIINELNDDLSRY